LSSACPLHVVSPISSRPNIDVRRLGVFDEGVEVTPERLVAAGLVPSLKKPIKILGDGDLRRPLVVKAHRFTQTARAKIEASGGRAEEI
jgi:large subunit ribosomal protein L15